MQKKKIYIYGKHAVKEALTHAPHAVTKVFLAPQFDDREIVATIKKCATPTGSFGKTVPGDLERGTPHQGILAVINPHKILLPLDAFLKELHPHTNTLLVLLDELEDPHNVGALIRSAAAFGSAGVFIPEHHQAPITGAVVKASAGMVFRVPLVTVGNVNQTIRKLKEKNFWVYGLDAHGGRSLEEESFDSPTLLIVGNEAGGIRQKTLELCDVRLAIPIHRRAESLNAAVAGGVALYAWSRRHPIAS